MTPDEATTFRGARDTEVKLLNRKPKWELVAVYQSCGGYTGNVMSKDELVSGILEMRGLTVDKFNESTHVLYHTDGTWSACSLCQCQVQWLNDQGFIDQCGLKPGHQEALHRKSAQR